MVRHEGTCSESALRREMHRIGLRYRINYKVLKKPRRVADVALAGRKVAVSGVSCFCHGHPEHATRPKQNAEFWREKIEANQRHVSYTNDRLRYIGWTLLRVWSHEPATRAARAVARTVALADSKHREVLLNPNKEN